MAEQWIPAAQALQIVGDPVALCIRLHAGLAKARAELLKRASEEDQQAEIPRGFWWAEGHEALEQDWVRGDFSTWIDHEYLIQAFGVAVGLSGLLEMVPFERRTSLTRSLSVAGNEHWVSAQEARKISHENGKYHAGQFIIEQARLGLVASKAVEAHGVKNHMNFLHWDWEEREWEIPSWYWGGFANGQDAKNDWELGRFSGEGFAPGGSRLIELSGVHFLRDDLLACFGGVRTANPENGSPDRGSRSRLSEAALQAWWSKHASVRDSLAQDELLHLIRAAFPENFISRDRVRALTGERKRGPKP